MVDHRARLRRRPGEPYFVIPWQRILEDIMPFLEVYRERGIFRRWRWRRVSANGRIIAGPQQGYTRKSSAKRSAIKNFPQDGEPREA